MALKLVWVEEEFVVKSVGDEPTGLLMVGGDADIGATLAIHTTIGLPAEPPGGVGYVRIEDNAVKSGEAKPITVQEAVEACDNDVTLAMIWRVVIGTLEARIPEVLVHFNAEAIQEISKLAVDLRDAMGEKLKERANA